MKETRETLFKLDGINENLIANIQGGVIICEFDVAQGKSKTVYLSEGWTELTGYTLEELNQEFGGNPQALICEEDAEQTWRDYSKQIEGSNSYKLQYRIRHKTGKLVWTVDRGVIVPIAEGVNRNQSIMTDITEIKENEEQLRLSEERLRVATRASNAVVFEFDSKENIYLKIENAEVIFGVSEDEVIEQVKKAKEGCGLGQDELEASLGALYHPEDISVIKESNQEMFKNGNAMCQVRVRRADGGYIWCRLNKSVIRDKQGQPARVIGHLVNIDEEKRQTDRLKLEAQCDSLAGVLNKSSTNQMIKEVLEHQTEGKHALLVLDIDDFKGVNDKLGHLFGDAVLIDISTQLKELFRGGDIIGRIGGDEFAMLMVNVASETIAAERAKAICEGFRHVYEGEKGIYRVSCSIGIGISQKGDTFDSLFSKADMALYEAKANGKDGFAVYSGQTVKDRVAYVHKEEERQSRRKLEMKERIFELLYDSVDFSGSVNMVLSLLGKHLGVERIYIMENSWDNKTTNMIYEWCSQGAASNLLHVQNVPLEETGYLHQFDENNIFLCKDVERLHPIVRDYYKTNGVDSFCQVAITENRRILGFVGYDSCGGLWQPEEEELDIMTFAAKVTGIFILKKRSDESSGLYNQNKMEALDKMPNIIYIIDQRFELQYMNNVLKQFYPELKEGQKCYESFLHKSAPCENCPAMKCGGDVLCSAEIFNSDHGMWVISNAAEITWRGQNNMKLICCQDISQFRK